MTIENISKPDNKATITLSDDELRHITNALYNYQNTHANNLYSELMITLDICQYGHIDNWRLSRIVECRGVDNIIGQIESRTK